MSNLPLHKCNTPGCRNSTDKRYCKPCNSKKDQHDSLYTSYQWRKARAAFLANHPFCQCTRSECGHSPEIGCLDVSTAIVDHIIPRTKGGATWDQSNWQRLCKRCHDRKTQQENDTKNVLPCSENGTGSVFQAFVDRSV